MRIVRQSVEWAQKPPQGGDVLKTIEAAGRTCYQSEPRGDAEAFVAMLIRRGHESVLEHISVSMRVVTDRGVSHEIVRHRIASYSQESTRYCRYDGEIQVIEPPGLGFKARALWEEGVRQAERAYLDMLRDGVSPQIARSVLPTCLKTELVMTMNLREFRHFFRLRLSKAAHPQMRELAAMLYEKLAVIPVVFDDLRSPYEEVSCPK